MGDPEDGCRESYVPLRHSAEAIKAARGIARDKGGEVFIHGRDGRIRVRDTHENDPLPPPG